jgi:hypothetical protein
MPSAPALAPRPVADVTTEDLGEDVCLYRANDEVLVLNHSAADVWRLCDGESSVTEIVAILARAYEMAPDDLRPDVQGVVTDLTERGYLASVPAER